MIGPPRRVRPWAFLRIARPPQRCAGRSPGQGTANRSTSPRPRCCCMPAAVTWINYWPTRPVRGTLASRQQAGSHHLFPKVFIPLTHLCRDRCHYCTFVTTPGVAPKRQPVTCHQTRFLRSPEQVRTRVPRSAFHPWGPSRRAVAAGSRMARRARLRRHVVLCTGYGRTGPRGDRAAAAPESRRA